MIKDLWHLYSLGVAVIVLIATITKQWQRVHRNYREVNKLDVRVEKMKEMFGRWQDKSETHADRIEKELSELKGSFKTFFEMWLKKNGK